MGNAANLVEICGMLLEQVKDKGAPEAEAEIELGSNLEGFVFHIKCRRSAGPQREVPKRKKTRKADSK